jgi:hypothetical protein
MNPFHGHPHNGNPDASAGPGQTRGAAANPGALARIDARLREELGMPFVPTVFQLLARHERYLIAATDALLDAAPADVTDHAARARQLGARAAASLVCEPLIAGAATQSIAALLVRYNEANARSLLLTTPMAGSLITTARVMEAPLPAPPSGSGADALLQDVRACHGHFNVPGLWRELAEGWPEPARRGWALVRRLPLAPDFAQGRQAVLELARDAVASRVAPTPREVGCSSQEVGEIEQILAWYQLVIPTMVVEIECLRRALALGVGTRLGRGAPLGAQAPA